MLLLTVQCSMIDVSGEILAMKPEDLQRMEEMKIVKVTVEVEFLV